MIKIHASKGESNNDDNELVTNRLHELSPFRNDATLYIRVWCFQNWHGFYFQCLKQSLERKASSIHTIFSPTFLKLQGCVNCITFSNICMLVWVALFLLIARFLWIMSLALFVNRAASYVLHLLLTCLNMITRAYSWFYYYHLVCES